VLWRRKEQFGEGTGMNDVLREHFESMVTAQEFEAEADVLQPPLRTYEELVYYRMFTRSLEGVDAGVTVGRFADASITACRQRSMSNRPSPTGHTGEAHQLSAWPSCGSPLKIRRLQRPMSP